METQSNRVREKIVFAAIPAIIVAFLLLRLISLQADFPAGITWSGVLYTDEGWYCKPAVSLQTAGKWYIQDDFDQAVNLPGLPLFQAAVFKTFGMSLPTARFTIVLFFFAMLASLFFFLKMYAGKRAALIAVILLSTNYLFFAYSRLAILEIPMTSLVMLSLLFAGIYSKSGEKKYLIFSALAFSLAVLTKTSASFAFIVILYVIFWKNSGSKTTYKDHALDILIFCFGAAIIVMGYYTYVYFTHPADFNQFYSLAFGKKRTPIDQSLLTLHYIFEYLLNLDILVYPITLLLGAYFLIFRKGLVNHKVLVAFLGWTLLYAVQLSSVQYHPPRYFLPAIFSLSVCAAYVFDQIIGNQKNAAFRILLVIFFGCTLLSTAVNSRKIISFMIDPNYSFINMCTDVKELMNTDHSGGKRALLLGNFANTVSMATGIPSINEVDTTITLDERLTRFQPTHYITLGLIKPEIAATLRKHYDGARMIGKWDCFNNYLANQPVYLWELVRNPAVPAGAHTEGSSDTVSVQ